ncbi:MAG: SGNH/GDSL hydrolase family protein, partial [Mycobacterium sp.]
VRLAFVVSTVVALAAVDLGAGFAWNLLQPSPAYVDPRPSLAAHESDAWAAEHYAAIRTTPTDYAPFLGFLRQDIHHDQLNVVHGMRRSYEPTTAPARNEPVVYYFGGSTMFGTSQRDLYTIPSYISRLAEADGYPIEVCNYGRGGYQSPQEVTLLQQLLAAGHRPDAVVFYDGHNDVYQQARVINTEPSHSQASRLQAMVEDQRASSRAGLPGIWADAKKVAGVLKRRSATLRLARNLKQR